MELTESQYQHLADCRPRQRGNVSMNNLQLLNALLYVVEHGCKWRGLPRRFGNWHTNYRWSKAGVLDRVFARLQQEQILALQIGIGLSGQPHHQRAFQWRRVFKKTAHKPSGVRAEAAPPRFLWLPRMLGAH